MTGPTTVNGFKTSVSRTLAKRHTRAEWVASKMVRGYGMWSPAGFQIDPTLGRITDGRIIVYVRHQSNLMSAAYHEDQERKLTAYAETLVRFGLDAEVLRSHDAQARATSVIVSMAVSS